MLLAPALLCLGSATAWAEESIVIDFARHGQSIDNVKNLLNTAPPGTELTAQGQTEAGTVAEALYQHGPYAGIYASELVRTQETAAPLASMLDMQPQILPGLNEIDAGLFDGQAVYSPEGILYLLAPFAWVFGAEFMPIPGSADPNGIAFEDSFNKAVQTIYDNTVGTAGSPPSDVAFSSEGAITTWTLMNVKNPDFAVVFDELLKTGQLLPNVGQVVVEGNPQQGWTLVSFGGQPVPQDPGLPTELFVDVRNLIEAPQLAAYNVYEAMLTGNSTTITDAIDAGINRIGTATENFPVAVFDDVARALGAGSTSAADWADVSGPLATMATDLSAALASL